MPKSITYKVITAGDGGVGKTTLLFRYVENKFNYDTKITIGVGFFFKTIDLGDENKYGLQLWDLGGEEQFRPFLKSYVAGADGAFLMIDLTRINSLKNIQSWVDIVRSENPELPILLLGSKLDLTEDISVTDEEPLRLKEKFKFIDYLKVSSKTGQNVDKAFETLIRKILEVKSL